MFAANEAWGANCGPAAIAAVLGMTLDQVRPFMGDFEKKHYTNPTLMWDTLRRIGALFSYRGGELGRNNWPIYGFTRIQWEGPWTRPGVPKVARYRHTHWIGVNAIDSNNIGIFDCNATGNGTGWTPLTDWENILVPWIIEELVPRANGEWHITHAVEIKLPWRFKG
ncbi:MAG: hypothetical protein KDJ69_12185 [Nitratireductor sp.]|nr:hypothetical protein [Nitratireductor sp.]